MFRIYEPDTDVNVAIGSVLNAAGEHILEMPLVSLIRKDVKNDSSSRNMTTPDLATASMPSSLTFPLDDARVIAIPEGVHFMGVCPIYLPTTSNEDITDVTPFRLGLYVLGLVKTDTAFLPVQLFNKCMDFFPYRQKNTYESPDTFATYSIIDGVQHVLYKMVTHRLPPSIRYVIVLTSNDFTGVTPEPGTIKVTTKFW